MSSAIHQSRIRLSFNGMKTVSLFRKLLKQTKQLNKQTNKQKVTDPAKWVDEFSKAGANVFTFHIEATSGSEAMKLCDTIRGKRNSREEISFFSITCINEKLNL